MGKSRTSKRLFVKRGYSLSYYQSTHSISVAAPSEKIYEAMTHWPLRAQWRRGIDISWEGDGKAFVGQKVTFKVKRPLFSYSFSFRITGLEASRRLYMEYFGKPLAGRAAVEINPSIPSGPSGQALQQGGCEVAFHWMKVEPAGLAAKLYFALGLGMRVHHKRTLETLRMLKEHLEKA